MIRKPDAHEFRESGAVSALRDARTLAVEGAKGVRDGTAMFVGRAFMGLMAFGFVMSMALHIGPLVLLMALAGGVAWVALHRKRRRRDLIARWPAGPSAFLSQPLASEPECYQLSVGAVGRHAATSAVLAILFFPTSSFFSFMLPFMLAGITYLALAMLLVARLAGDRTVIRYDAQTLTVFGLLGETTILWADVGDVVVRKSSRLNLHVLFTSGARRNLVVLGRINRLGGADTLYVPVDLLGLDRDALHALVTRMLLCKAEATDVDRAAAPRTVASGLPPRLTSTSATFEAFDPGAIIARHIAERDHLRAEQRPDLSAPRRATFGRKTV
jgi:hypothetical protein